MSESTTILGSTSLLGWLLYGSVLIGCIFGSLVASTRSRPRAALAFGTVVWSGACLPFAAMARGTEDGSVLVYGTAGIIAVGFLFVFSTLSGARTVVSPE